MIDLSSEDLVEIQRILHRHVPDCEVRAFGSRVRGRASKYSDLDLAIVAARPVADAKFAELKNAFAESDLPIRIDVLDWHALSDRFRKAINSDYEVMEK